MQYLKETKMIYEHPYANLHLEKEREKNVNTMDNIM